ncbi:MAG: methyltransferase domain-containing protein [Bauldia sp.]|nr:methyltransferase domain-containing protein [Bauldia sp.]MCW5716858.1 methyltransferase domain-containing protein [Bauldia sp.]
MSLSDIAKYIRTWGTTGAIAPSGKALARRMVRHVDPAGSGMILELGPGTGVVTRALLEKGVAPARIIAVEFNPDFCRIVGERYPGVRVVQGDAYSLDQTLHGIHDGGFAAAVSSLPLLLREPADRINLVKSVLARLPRTSALAQFSYSPKPPVPASPLDWRLEGSGWILMNMPPARVWTYRPV